MKLFLAKHIKLHIWFITAIFIFLTYSVCQFSKPVMNFLADYITTPIKQMCAGLCSVFSFSVAELTIVLFVLFLLVMLVRTIVLLIKRPNRLHTLYTSALGALSIAVTIYTAFCLFWGANYHADSFQEKAGILTAPTSVENLYSTAKFFAQKTAETSANVSRDENGLFSVPQEEFFAQSVDAYRNIEAQYPFLAIKDHIPKGIMTSELLSYTGFTGFFFPFTGEANINIHAPACMMPATILHELAHQRNIASEDEANFVSILACTQSGNPTFEYSGYLIGYVYLANALYLEDNDKWAEVRSLLSDYAVTDLNENNLYWQRYETIVSEVSEEMYDTFLKSYGEESGIKTYGEVVDLLIAYYCY